jgi:intracellular septation protein
MKFIFDVLPLVFFFATYKFAGRMPDQGAAFATHWLGAIVQGGVVGATEAPALLATVVVLVATLVQVAWMKAAGRKIDMALWISLVMIVIFGGLTVWFHNQMFIMWKPTIYFWGFGLVFWGSKALFGRNLFRSMLTAAEVELPDAIWQRLNASWIVLCLLIGALNLVMVYFLRDYWAAFHTFGTTGLMLAFFGGMVFYLGKHLEPHQPADEPAP